MSVESYEQVPYRSRPFAFATADRMAVIARLFGLNTTLPANARVLEIGCAGGGNLIPRALALPQASFIGIDPAEKHIREAVSVAGALGLTNIQFQKRGVEELNEADGQFDYIICHGVYSWVPAEIRDQLLLACRDRLTRNGVAYISYNTLPGWHMRQMIRDAMLFHVEPLTDNNKRIEQARAMVAFLAESRLGGTGPWQRLLTSEIELLDSADDHYLFHDHLASTNSPVYVRDFIAHAEGAGLAYLGEAVLADMLTVGLSETVRKAIDTVSSTPSRRQQYLDFVVNRGFRRSLLRRADAEPASPLRWSTLRSLWVGSSLKPAPGTALDLSEGVEVTFEGKGGKELTTSAADVKVGWAIFAERFPQALAFSDWVAQVAARLDAPDDDLEASLGKNLLYALGQGLAEAFSHAVTMTGHLSEKPKAFGVARLQALAHSEWATTRRHECYNMDALDHHVLALCDGTRTRGDMVAALAQLARADVVALRHDDDTPVGDEQVEDVVRELLDQRLTYMGQLGLLDADETA